MTATSTPRRWADIAHLEEREHSVPCLTCGRSTFRNDARCEAHGEGER